MSMHYASKVQRVNIKRDAGRQEVARGHGH